MIKTKLKQLVNKSFVTNQDLLQQLKNRSFINTKQDSHRLHSQQSKINLIKKKSFDRLHTQQQNSFITANNSLVMSSSDKAICLLQDIIAQLGSNNKICHKLKKVLVYIRQTLSQQKKTQREFLQQKQQLQKHYMRQFEIELQQKKKLKKLNEEAKAKLNEYRQKILSIRKQVGGGKQNKQPLALQQIIINQSQIIDQQCDENYHQSNQMRRILKTQALQIEQFLNRKTIKEELRQDSYIRQYNSLGNSFFLKH